MSRLTLDQKRAILSLVQDQISGFQSRWSDPSDRDFITRNLTWKTPRPTHANDCIALYGAILKVVEERFWESEKVVRYLSNQCYIHQYDQGWKTLQDYLENVTTFDEFRRYSIDEKMNVEDYYGNLEPKIYRFIRTFKAIAEGEVSGRVKKSTRRRGYRDKGTLRPDWTKRNVALLNDEREDRRYLVLHPLIGEKIEREAEELSPGGRSGLETPTDKKGGEKSCSLISRTTLSTKPPWP